MATRKKPQVNETWPKITKGTHLTVTLYEDGKSELLWDDEQLLKEVRDAISSLTEKKKGKKK